MKYNSIKRFRFATEPHNFRATWRDIHRACLIAGVPPFVTRSGDAALLRSR
jgi:hypothetical protein